MTTICTCARCAHAEDRAHEDREAAYRDAAEALHQRHGGNEYMDDDCTVCIDAWESWMLWGISIDTRLGL